jgi:hypothetical protein
MIQRGPHILNGIANKHKQGGGGVLSVIDFEENLSRWNILLTDNFVGADLQESRDLIIQGLPVFVCPDELPRPTRYCKHLVE